MMGGLVAEGEDVLPGAQIDSEGYRRSGPNELKAADPPPLSPLKTSVVLCTFNGERFIEAQIRSLIDQTEPPAEVLVGDDQSSDCTVKILTELANVSPFPIRIHINETRLGYGENFLRTASRASGDLVAFCDQDDIWMPRKLEVCRAAFSNQHVMLAAHSARLVDEAGKVIGVMDQGISATRTIRPLSREPWSCYFGFTIVIRRELLSIVPASLRGVDFITGLHSLSHDRWISFLANMVGSTSEIKDDLVLYRQHGRNLFGATGKASVQRVTPGPQMSALYLRAAREHLRIIEYLSGVKLSANFSFDPARASAFWKRAIGQQRDRNAVHTAPTVIAALRHLLRNVRSGTYRDVSSRNINHRSLLRDFQLAVSPHLRPVIERND